MKNKTIQLVISLFTLLTQTAFCAEFVEEYPLETLLFKLPDNNEGNWKEISHYLNKTDGISENIPLNQTINNWSNLICIQYSDISTESEKVRNDIQFILDNLKNRTLSTYPEKQASWKIIEKTDKDALYEWTLYLPNENARPQHEIARAILSNTGFHRIGITKKNGIMSDLERQKWIKLLKENSSIISLKEAEKLKGLSLANKLKDSLSLEANFSDWKAVRTFSSDNGNTQICYIPPSQTVTKYITECIEITTMPNTQQLSARQFFEREKTAIENQSNGKAIIQILQKLPKEILYTYSFPKDHIKRNFIVRTFVTDHGYYSIQYMHEFEGIIEKEESLKWLEKLKTIHVKNRD